MTHLSSTELRAGLEHVKLSPQDNGTLDMIVIRPARDERTVVEQCELSAALGVHGDDWETGSWKKLPDGKPNPDVQATLMNSRAVQLMAQDRSRWPLAGDNLYVDLDLSFANIPCGQTLAVGSVLLEVTGDEHLACRKFEQRYGTDAMALVNSEEGKELRLRGLFAKVLQDGTVAVGDTVKKV